MSLLVFFFRDRPLDGDAERDVGTPAEEEAAQVGEWGEEEGNGGGRRGERIRHC